MNYSVKFPQEDQSGEHSANIFTAPTDVATNPLIPSPRACIGVQNIALSSGTEGEIRLVQDAVE